MARACSVCAHEEAFAINETLVLEGKSNRATARHFGLHHDAVRRHREHIPELLLQARDSLELYNIETILGKIEELERETLEQLEGAKGKEDGRLVLSAIREQRQNLELVARVLQIINTAPQLTVLVNHPQWVTLRTNIMAALQPHPEARVAVAGAIEQSLQDERSENNGRS